VQPPSHPLIPAEIDAEMTPAVRAFVHALIAGFQSQIVDLNAKIAALESQVKKLTPQNSSVPPSNVHPHGKPKRDKPKSGKNRGGQKGHPRHQRVLVPVDQCDSVVVLAPKACRCCQEPLSGEDPAPIRHQVYELPPIKAIITEYQRQRLKCTKCGTTTCAELPTGVPSGQSGPRLIAFTALLMGHFRQSKRLASEFLRDLLNIPCCPATTVKMQGVASAALAKPHEDLRQALATERNVFMDETPTKEANTKAWLWTAVANQFVVFSVFASRAATAIESLLGANFEGIINCDRAKMYYIAKHLQWCWAHLIRDIQAMIDSKVPERVGFGTQLMTEVKEIFRLWHRFQQNEIAWDEFQTSAVPIAMKINQLLFAGTGSHDSKLRNQCKSLYAHRNRLWLFISNQGLEPTNNRAERALRKAVIYRKLSFGTQSENGSRFIERIFSVAETCRMQNRSVYQYLVQAVEAKLANQSVPSLLPAP
jgi:transposase